MATATIRGTDTAQAHGFAGSVKHRTATVELSASASGTTIDFGEIPSNARILGASKVYWDDLATSGSPTLDVGFGAVDGNITSDPDAVNDGLALSSASSGNLVKDIANHGLPAWDFVNGQSTDPGGVLNVYATVKDAATNAAGTVTLDLYYSID